MPEVHSQTRGENKGGKKQKKDVLKNFTVLVGDLKICYANKKLFA